MADVNMKDAMLRYYQSLFLRYAAQIVEAMDSSLNENETILQFGNMMDTMLAYSGSPGMQYHILSKIPDHLELDKASPQWNEFIDLFGNSADSVFAARSKYEEDEKLGTDELEKQAREYTYDALVSILKLTDRVTLQRALKEIK